MAPVLIENVVKELMPFVANSVVVGDRRKYLVVLLTLKAEADGRLTRECLQQLEPLEVAAKTVKEARTDPRLRAVIEKALGEVNRRAISKAQHLIKHCILEQDFTPENGMMTPTLKLKRKEISARCSREIEAMYDQTEARL